jgi:hypothetical protein
MNKSWRITKKKPSEMRATEAHETSARLTKSTFVTMQLQPYQPTNPYSTFSNTHAASLSKNRLQISFVYSTKWLH